MGQIKFEVNVLEKDLWGPMQKCPTLWETRRKAAPGGPGVGRCQPQQWKRQEEVEWPSHSESGQINLNHLCLITPFLHLLFPIMCDDASFSNTVYFVYFNA